MVSKQLLTSYDFDSVTEYFQMCFDSLINGQMKQAKEQALELSRKQRKSFIDYLETYYSDDKFYQDRYYFKKLMLEN